MKKIIAIIIILVCFVSTATAENLYPRFGNVIDLEWDSDCVSADDGLGNIWEFWGCDHFFFGDLVIMIMSDNGTPDWIYDDRVINAYPCSIDESAEIIQKYRENNSENLFNFLKNLF